MELENDVAVSGEPKGFADAEPEDAADLPVVEDKDEDLFGDSDDEDADGLNGEDDGMGFAPEEGEDARDFGKEPGEDAGDVGRQPDKGRQSRAEDAKYAAARRDAERAQREAEEKARVLEDRANCDRERMDAFAREHGYMDWTALEKAERVRTYIRGGATPELADHMAGQAALLQHMLAERNRGASPNEDDCKWDALVAAFPETRRMEALPDEVTDAIAAGMPPADAYRDYKMRELQTENEALKQNRRNKGKAIGNVKGRGAQAQHRDAFVNGLYGL